MTLRVPGSRGSKYQVVLDIYYKPKGKQGTPPATIISINFLFWVKNKATRDNEEVIFASLDLDVTKQATIKYFFNTEMAGIAQNSERTANSALAHSRIPPRSPPPPSSPLPLRASASSKSSTLKHRYQVLDPNYQLVVSD